MNLNNSPLDLLKLNLELSRIDVMDYKVTLTNPKAIAQSNRCMWKVFTISDKKPKKVIFKSCEMYNKPDCQSKTYCNDLVFNGLKRSRQYLIQVKAVGISNYEDVIVKQGYNLKSLSISFRFIC